MGKRGRIPKQANRTVGHRESNISVLPGGRNEDQPKPNYNWLSKTRKYWQNYWDSDLSSTAQQVDYPAFYRLFQYYDETERANRTIHKMGSEGLLGIGSTGQPTINPLITLTLKLEEKILKLEQELGLTPLARQRLGIAFGEAQMGFKQLQQLLQEDDEKELDDPRLLMLEEE